MILTISQSVWFISKWDGYISPTRRQVALYVHWSIITQIQYSNITSVLTRQRFRGRNHPLEKVTIGSKVHQIQEKEFEDSQRNHKQQEESETFYWQCRPRVRWWWWGAAPKTASTSVVSQTTIGCIDSIASFIRSTNHPSISESISDTEEDLTRRINLQLHAEST